MKTMREAVFCGAAVAGCLLSSGCKHTADITPNYVHAVNTYYEAHPRCLWTSEIKFPVQADTSDTSKTSGYDALVDQGLLVRTTAEKKKLIIVSKQVNNYDLSDKGRGAWMADTQQPGFGNFCYGHRSTSGIDASTPTTGDPGTTTQVDFHTTISGAPGWATAAETQTAYPALKADLAGPTPGHAVLVETAGGWQVKKMSGAASNVDSTIVQ